MIGELDSCHGTVGTSSFGSSGSISCSISNARSLQLEFGKDGVMVLVVVAGATLTCWRDELIQGRSLLPNDAVGTDVVAGSHGILVVRGTRPRSISCTKGIVGTVLRGTCLHYQVQGPNDRNTISKWAYCTPGNVMNLPVIGNY